MNFETKYLIRWGIPGWTLLILIATMYARFNWDQMLKGIENIDILSLVGFLLSAGFIGVPIGYLCHQLYFSVNWIFRFDVVIIFFNFMRVRVLKKEVTEDCINLIEDEYRHKFLNGINSSNHSAYYHLEATWHEELLRLDPDKRNYIAERYRHYLNTIHSLGALFAALLIAIIVNITLFVIFISENTPNLTDELFTLTLIILNLYLIVSVFAGFRYYSNNLNHFQAHMFNKMFEEKFNQKSP